MKEHEDIFVAVANKYTLDGAIIFTLVNTSIKRIRMNDVIMLIIMYYCDDFQVNRFIKCLSEWEAAKDHGSSRLQTSQGRSYLKCKGNGL